jgi:hypothetical protein
MRERMEARIAEIVGAVARQALADRGLARIALLDDGSRQAQLAARMLARTLGEEAVVRVTAAEIDPAPFLAEARHRAAWQVEEEIRRLRARLMEDALPAHPANKTALLLGGELPPEPLLPLGDLWASDVLVLCGACSAPPEIAALARAAGGVPALDDALRALVDGRDPAALERLPREAADQARRMLAAGRSSRRNPRTVPKLGGRTLCIDLME